MKLFETSYFELGSEVTRHSFDVTDENYLEVLKMLIRRRPMCCCRYVAEFVIKMVGFTSCPSTTSFEEWIRRHCMLRYGNNWNVDAEGVDNFLYQLLKFYIDKVEEVDRIFVDLFGVSIAADFAKEPRPCS